jgi:hypothetical protein
MLFIIPQPIGASSAAPERDGRFEFLGGASGPAVAAPTAPAEPELLHIPCPNGHELETPAEMLDQEVLCPQCNAQFRLRRKNSVEYQKKKEMQEAVRLERVGGLWLTWAIIAVIAVVVGLVALIGMSQMSQPPLPK